MFVSRMVRALLESRRTGAMIFDPNWKTEVLSSTKQEA